MFKKLELKARTNKKTGAIDLTLPRREFSKEELNKIQEEKIISLLWEK